MEKGGAVVSWGRTEWRYSKPLPPGKIRAVLGSQWAELQVLRSTDALASAKALFGCYGVYSPEYQTRRAALKKDVQEPKPHYSIIVILNP